MNPIIQKRYDKAGPRVAAALSRRNMEAFYCPTAIEGAQKVLELIAPEDVVSWGGAMTADEMHATTKDNCLADSSAFFLSFCPMYWEQTIVPPAASA